MGLSEVSNILWRERQLLELLLFKLEEEQLVLASGRSRWLSHATREVEMVIDELKQSELSRAVEVDAVGRELGLQPNASLRELSDAAPQPWDKMLEDHRKAFLVTTQEILTLAQANKELLSQGHSAAREALAWLGETDAEVYDSHGTASSATFGPHLVNKAV